MYAKNDMEEYNITQRAIKWINSEDGKRSLKKSFSDSKKLTEYLKEQRKVDPKTLLTPFTI